VHALEDLEMSSSNTDFSDEFQDLQKGIEMERECLAFYRATLSTVSNPGVRDLCEWLIAYEDTHIAELEAISEDVSKEGAWTTGLDERLKLAVKGVGDIPRPDETQIVEPNRDILMSIRWAINLLKQLASIYFTALRRARNDHVRVMWRYLSEKVKAQKEVLEDWFNYLLTSAIGKKSS
jgi:rubrerythrin